MEVIKIKEKKDLNQPHYDVPIVSASFKLGVDLKNIEKDSFYENSKVFPPKGSYINIPEDVLSGTKSDVLYNKKVDKNNLDLYK